MKSGWFRCLIVIATFPFVSCQDVERALRHGQDVLPAEPPLHRVETSDGGVTLDVWLTPGVGLSQVVDLSLFPPLWPGITPDEARRQFGAPAEIYGEGHEKHYVYKTPKTAVSIVETVAISSADGKPFKSYELRAQAGPRFEEQMTPALRRLISGHPAARTLRLASVHPTDPAIHLHIRNGRVHDVTAWPIQQQRDGNGTELPEKGK